MKAGHHRNGALVPDGDFCQVVTIKGESVHEVKCGHVI
jgi:hypothetical protein